MKKCVSVGNLFIFFFNCMNYIYRIGESELKKKMCPLEEFESASLFVVETTV